MKQKDLYAIGVLINCLTWPDSDYTEQCRYNLEASDKLDRRRIAYTFCCDIDDRQKEPQGYHCGDCTRMAASCSRCISEEIYIEGLETLDEFNTFIAEKNIICLDPCLKMLAILFAVEHLYIEYQELLKISVNRMIGKPEALA